MGLMYLALDVSYWITLALAFPAAGFMIRNFIVFHDCGHGSFFKSRKANRILGFFTGLIAFMPSYYWSHQHAKHHATAGDLDHRGDGDVWTLTVQEYLALSRWKRICYRTYRNPVFLFGVVPLYFFLVYYRYWRRGDSVRVRWSTMRTNVALVAIVTAASLTIGIKAYLMIQLPILIVGGSAGVWLFYIQHQFEHTYWERHPVGDCLLQAIAQILEIRVGDKGEVIRFGGDEFVVLLPQTPTATAVEISNLLCNEVASKSHSVSPDQSIQVTTSFGCATHSIKGDFETSEDLLEAADQALYLAKQGGKNQVGVYSAELKATAMQ